MFVVTNKEIAIFTPVNFPHDLGRLFIGMFFFCVWIWRNGNWGRLWYIALAAAKNCRHGQRENQSKGTTW